MKIKPQKIIDARKILEHVDVVDEEGRVESEYRGYISSFGASIKQSGLIPSVAFYENKNSNSQEDKTKITKAILLMLDGKDSKYTSLLDYLLDNGYDLTMQKKVIDQAIALKLALNTYKVKKGKSDEKS